MAPAKNPRINVALEVREDTVLARVADRREATLAGRRTATHDEFWE